VVLQYNNITTATTESDILPTVQEYASKPSILKFS